MFISSNFLIRRVKLFSYLNVNMLARRLVAVGHCCEKVSLPLTYARHITKRYSAERGKR